MAKSVNVHSSSKISGKASFAEKSNVQKSSSQGPRAGRAGTVHPTADGSSKKGSATIINPLLQAAGIIPDQPQAQQQTQFSDEANNGQRRSNNEYQKQKEKTRYLDEAVNGRANAEKAAQDKARGFTAETDETDRHADNYRSYLNEADRLTIEKTNSEGLTMEEQDEYDRRIKEAKDKAEEERKAAGIKNTKDKLDDLRSAPLLSDDEQEAWAFLGPNEDVENQVGGWGRQFASGPAMAAGTALQWFDQTSDDMVRYEYDQEHGEGAYDAAIAGKNVNQVGQLGNKIWDTGVGLRESGQQMWEAGIADMSDLGKEIATVGKAGADLAADAGLNFVMPGLGTMRMYMGAMGDASYEQSQREKNDIDSRMLSMVKAGASAYLSNKLVGDVIYGKGVIPKEIGKMLGKLSPEIQKVVRPLLNSEGVDEGLENILNWGGDIILGLDTGKPLDWNEVKQDAFIGYVLGVVTNGLAGGMNIDSKRQQAIAQEAVEFAESGLTVEEAAEIAKQNTKDQVVMKAAPEGEPSSTVTVPLTETAPMETSPNPMIAAIQERMTISPREASQIRNNPELRAAFEEAYGISLDGLGEKAAAKAITDAVKNQGIHERSVNQFGELPEAAPSFAPAETGPNKSERAFARGGKARDAITSILAGDDISRKDATRIMSDPVMWEAFQEATGIDLSKKGKTEQNVREAFREAKANQNQEAQADLQTQFAEAEAELDNYLDGLQGTPGELKTPEYNDLVNRVNDLRSQLGMEPGTTGTETTAETNANGVESEATPAQEETVVKEETPSQNQNESNAKPAQNKPKKPDHSRKVTNPNEDTDAAFDKLNEKNGSIEPGENPARDINVPKKDTKGLKVGEGARTIFEADATPDERIASLKAAVVNGNFGHIPVSNDTRSNNAIKRLAKEGWTKSVADFMAAVDSGKVDADTIALGAHLLNEAGNSNECSGKQYVELAMAYNDAVSGSGKALAAARILKTLTPEGKLYGMEKAVEKINKEIRKNNEKKKLGKQKAEVKLNEELVEDYLKAETDEQRDAIHDEIIKDAAAQVPNTFRDKFTALRYLNMLGNFKTQVRNVLGNVGMTAAQKLKNEVRSGLEGIASATSGGKYERQYKARYGFDRLKAASADFASDEDLQKIAMGEKKFSDVAKQSEAEILDEKKPFSDKNPLGKFLNGYSKVTNAAMELGDLVFVRANYADALAGYMNAHGITAADWKAMVNDPAKSAEVEKARNFAIKQAQEATFRDTNAVSSFASSFDRNWGKGPRAVAQGVIPFRRTPANVLVRMEEYSPLGAVNTIVKGIQSAKGTAEVSDVIDSAAKSVTGTGLTYLGYLLASMGKARTKDDDKNEEALAKLRGQQDYSIEVGGKSVTMDWLSPASAPFFMGVELYNLMKDGGINPSEAMAAITSFTNPMLEMSMLSGVNDALNNLSDFEGDNSAVLQFFLNSAWSYLTQGISNTMLGQVEQFSEKNRQTYYTDSDNPLLRPSAQKKLAKLGNKTPGVDYQSADYIDAWGRKQEADRNPVTRGLNTFLNPGYVSDLDKKATEADAAIEELYQFGKKQKEEDNFPNVIPRTPSRSTTVNGKKLTPQEYDVYATTKGQESLKAVSEFVNSEQFKSMDRFSQAQTISDIYSYSEFLAAKKIAERRGEEYYDDRYSQLLTGQKEDGDNTYKAPIKEADIPEYLGFMNAYNRAMNAKDYDEIDALIDSAATLPESAMVGATQHAQDMEALVDMKKAGLSDANVWYQFKDDMKDIYTSEKRVAASSPDYIRAIGSGNYSNEDADAIMGYERRRSEETIQRKKDQVQYNLDKAGMGGAYDKVWSMIESVDNGDMSKDSFNKYIDKNVPIQYRQKIKDVCSDYVEDRHKAGKSVSGFYQAVRDAGYDAEIAAQFFDLIDTDFNGRYKKSEVDAAVRKGFGTGADAKAIRKSIKENTGI